MNKSTINTNLNASSSQQAIPLANESEPQREEAWYKQFWPWFVFSLPGSVVVAGLYTVFIALTNPHIMVVDDYYKEGLAINRSFELHTNANSLGLSAELQLNRDTNKVSCILRAKNNSVFPETLTLALLHPTDSQYDIHITLEKVGSGVYESPIDLNEAFYWHYRIRPNGTQNENDWILQGVI